MYADVRGASEENVMPMLSCINFSSVSAQNLDFFVPITTMSEFTIDCTKAFCLELILKCVPEFLPFLTQTS